LNKKVGLGSLREHGSDARRTRFARSHRTLVTVERDRNGIIDAYRGIAVIAVMSFHYFVRWAPPYNAMFAEKDGVNLYHYDHVYSPLFELGQFGVVLFFVISGLVITMTILRCRSALQFAVRRFARLFPALVVSSLLTLTIVNLVGPSIMHRDIADWLTSLTLDPEHLGHKTIDGAYWSLLAEVKFYFWVALFYHLLGPRFWIGLVALGVAAIPVHFVHHTAIGYLVPSYMAFFLLGVSAWQLLFERDRVAGAIVGVAAVALYAIQLPSYMDYVTLPSLKPTAEIALTCTIALMLLTIGLPAPRWLAPLSTIGRWSYSLYLLHQHIGVSIVRLAKSAGAPDLTAIAISASIVVALAWLVYEWVELPGKTAVMRTFRATASRRPAM
jgi:peptidoglycan/LPS O-acetylase OafA/YrhL